MRQILRLLALLPIIAAQGACLYLLFRSKLSLKPASSRFWPPLAFCLYCAGATAFQLLAPSWTRLTLELILGFAFALMISAKPGMRVVLWAAVGSLPLQGARFATEAIGALTGLSARIGEPDPWPGILLVLIEIGCLAALTLPAVLSPRLPDELPARVLNVGSIAGAALCAVADASLQFAAGSADWAANPWTALGVPALCVACLCVILYLMSQIQPRGARTSSLQGAGAGDRIAEDRDFVRRWRHDEKQHLAVLSRLARTGRADELIAYLESLSSRLNAADPACRVGDVYIDALLEEKRARCEEAGIEWRMLVSEDFDAGAIDGPAMATILGNAFENAIESCERAEGAAPFIESQFQAREDMLKISIANSVGRERGAGDPARTSKATDRHGLGLSQIACAAEGAGGFLRVRRLPSLFRLDVWLPRGGEGA